MRKKSNNCDPNIIGFPKRFTVNLPQNVADDLREKEEILNQTYMLFQLHSPFTQFMAVSSGINDVDA